MKRMTERGIGKGVKCSCILSIPRLLGNGRDKMKKKIPAVRQLPSGVWFCQLRLRGQDGKVRSISISDEDRDKVEARALAIKTGAISSREAPRCAVPLSRAIDVYITARRSTLSAATVRGYRTIQRYRFQGYMSRRLDSLTESVCRRMVNEEAELVSPKTVKNAWGLVSAVLKSELGVSYNIRLPQVPPAPRGFLDAEQIPVFLAAVRGSSVEIPALLALHSLRLSEVLGLTWDRIDLDRGTVTVAAAMIPDEENRLVYKRTTKNVSSARTIPIMIPALSDALAAVEDKTGPLVKANRSGITGKVNRICARAGLPAVGMHGLRHSFASLAYHVGLSEKLTMELGGWSNDATMKKIYTHIASQDVARGENALRDFFRAAASGTSETYTPQDTTSVSISVSN